MVVGRILNVQYWKKSKSLYHLLRLTWYKLWHDLLWLFVVEPSISNYKYIHDLLVQRIGSRYMLTSLIDFKVCELRAFEFLSVKMVIPHWEMVLIGFKTILTNMKVYGSILEYSNGIVTYVKGTLGFLKVLQCIWKVF
jgi:hypothetical protein